MIKKKVGVIVQARMGSTRLPGKVLKKLDNKITVLQLLIKRLNLSKKTDVIIIATTPDKENQKIINHSKSRNILFFIGSEENVLERYFKAAKKFKLDIIIRITSDCPFIDPKMLDDMILFFLENDYDYIRNREDAFSENKTNIPRGFDIEIFTFKVLEKTYSLAKTKSEKEHVTYFIYTHPELFKIYYYNIEDLKEFKELRLTIDEKEDLTICREVFKKLKEYGHSLDFSIFDVINIIEENQDLMNINKHMKQKKV